MTSSSICTLPLPSQSAVQPPLPGDAVAVGGGVAVGVGEGGAAGVSLASPGNVRATISSRLLKPSPSESADSIGANLSPAF
ncbi:MAG: hypothetical protein ABI629_02110 [bacterium]